MKNLVGYILGFALCTYFMHDLTGHLENCTCNDPLIHSGQMFAAAFFIIGIFAAFCGILVESGKLIGKIILNNLHKSEK